MVYKIINFFMTENGIEVLKLVVTIIIAYITAKLTAKNSKRNLTTQFFKEKGTELQEKILRFWCSLFMKDFNIQNSYKESFDSKESINDLDIIIKVQKESYIYCSSKTIKAIKEYQQYIYRSKDINNKMQQKDEKKKTWKKICKYIKEKVIFLSQLILITRIISRMKYDFTGEKVDELDLIKIKIRDFNIRMRVFSRIILLFYNIKEIFFKIILILIIICVCLTVIK